MQSKYRDQLSMVIGNAPYSKIIGTCGRPDMRIRMLGAQENERTLYVKTKNRPTDCDGRLLQPGDIVLAGMRYGDPGGWTLEKVVVVVVENLNLDPEIDDGPPVVQESFNLSCPQTGEFMSMTEPGLTKYMSREDEAEWRLGTQETRMRFLPAHARKGKR